MRRINCDKGFIWNANNCECKSHFSENLEYKNCKSKKRLADKFVEECTENIEEIRLVEITSAKN